MSRRAVRHRWSWLGRAGVALLLIGFARIAVDTPPLLLGIALLPAAACAAAVILLGRHTHPPRRLLAGTFLWGAVAAPVVAMVLLGALRVALPEGTAATLAAPVIEETAKAAALLLIVWVWRDEIDGIAAGILYGALIGIGFTMTENLFYFFPAALLTHGPGGLAESVYLRAALGGFRHAVFTAATGAGFGWGYARGGAARVLGPLLGLGLAVVQHGLWNAIGAEWLDSAPCAPAAAACPLAGRLWYWLVSAPAIVALFFVPALALLVLAVRQDGLRLPMRPLQRNGGRR